MVEFMNTLGNITGDTAIEASIRSAFPTPFENSFYRTMRWRETGMSPTLDRMFSENRFVVDSVPVGSLADSLGFRAGDSIIAIDGISTDTLKDVCKRSLLHKEKGAEVIYSIRRSGTTVQLRSRAE
jgi:C-terminal processing protease CtpA/Prc